MAVSSASLPNIDKNLKRLSAIEDTPGTLVVEGHMEKATELLDEEADTDLSEECKTILLESAQEGRLEYVELALEWVAEEVEESEVAGLYARALQAAAYAGHIDIVTKLLDEGADVNFQGGDCGNALHAAVMGLAIDAVELLLSKGADVNAEGGPYETALNLAVICGSREIVTRLLAKGARADRQNVNGFYPLQCAVSRRRQDISNDLLPGSTHALASIKASEWRYCHGDGNDHLELYFDPVPAIRKVTEMDFYYRNYPVNLLGQGLSYAEETRNFMVNDSESKRIFLLANGTLLLSQGTGYHCFGFELNDYSGYSCWSGRDYTMGRKARLSQLPKEHCFVKCWFTTNSITLAFTDTRNGQQSNSTPEIKDTSKTHGLSWIMTKTDTTTASETCLEPKAFFTTSEYAQIPPRASALLLPLMEELQNEWEKTFETAQGHLSRMRMTLLRARGLNTDLIQALLKDSLLWDEIEQACRKQISELKEFHRCFWKSTTPHDPTPRPGEQTLPEDSQGSEESDLEAFSVEVEKLQTFHEVELKALKEMSQSLIQLEFNLTSIAEAQLSRAEAQLARSTNLSMKRLSWITFIFLPPMFVASVFGMNIDQLASNPSAWWPVVIAVPISLIAFCVVFFLRRMERPGPQMLTDLDLEEGKQQAKASRWRMTWFSDDRKKLA